MTIGKIEMNTAVKIDRHDLPINVVELSGGQNGGGGGPRNQHGLTVKEETFARHVAEGKTQSEAYRLAYNAQNMKPQTIWHEAHLTAKRPAVKERINGLINAIEKEALHDSAMARTFILERLWHEASDMQSRASERLKAVELLGKLAWVGAFKERSEITTEFMTSDKLKGRIEELLARIEH